MSKHSRRSTKVKAAKAEIGGSPSRKKKRARPQDIALHPVAPATAFLEADVDLNFIAILPTFPAVAPRLHHPWIIGVLLLASAFLLWALAVSSADQGSLTDYGIVSILPLVYWISLAVLTIGFCYSIHASRAGSWLRFSYVMALIVLLHGTPTIVYQTLRYPWAWKHLGIVDYIQRHHAVDLVAPFLSVYHNWPGLFVATAAIADAFHLNSTELAEWVKYTPPLLAALDALVLIPLYRNLTNDDRVVYAGIWFFVAGNWVGQEYFSPQGFCFLLYLSVIALCIGPLKNTSTPNSNDDSRLSVFQRACAAFLVRVLEFPSHPAAGLKRTLYSLVVFLLIAAITATHQLTPVALIFTLAALAAVGRVSIWFCVFAILMEMAWLLYFAAPFVAVRLARQLQTLGEGISASSEGLVSLSNMTRGQLWVVLVGRSVTLCFALIAIVGGIRRLAQGFRDGVAIALVLSALPLFLTRYEGEILFRVYLFASPFLAIFAAMAFFPDLRKGKSWMAASIFGLATGLTATAFLFANNGKDLQYAFAKDEVETMNWLFVNAPSRSLLVDGTRNYPTQFRYYEKFSYVSIFEESAEQQQRILDDPVSVLAGWLSDTKWSASYIIITTSQKASVDAQHLMPPGALDKIENALLASPKFVLVKASRNAEIFSLIR